MPLSRDTTPPARRRKRTEPVEPESRAESRAESPQAEAEVPERVAPPKPEPVEAPPVLTTSSGVRRQPPPAARPSTGPRPPRRGPLTAAELLPHGDRRRSAT